MPGSAYAIGGFIATMIAGAVAAWRRATAKSRRKRARPAPSREDDDSGEHLSETTEKTFRESAVALRRSFHRIDRILSIALQEMIDEGYPPVRCVLFIAHNGADRVKTLKTQIKVRALGEVVYADARHMLEDWLQPRPMVGDYLSLLVEIAEAEGRAVVLAPTDTRNHYPTVHELHRSDGINSNILALVCEHDDALYYVSAMHRELDATQTRAVSGLMEDVAKSLRPVVRNSVMSTQDVTG
jgi:hypothetical protein